MAATTGVPVSVFAGFDDARGVVKDSNVSAPAADPPELGLPLGRVVLCFNFSLRVCGAELRPGAKPPSPPTLLTLAWCATWPPPGSAELSVEDAATCTADGVPGWPS